MISCISRHELTETDIAAAVECGGALGETRQRVEESLLVQRIVKVRIGLDEKLPGFLRVVGDEDRGLLHGGEETRQAVVFCEIAIGDEDQLVIGRHAMLLREERAAFMPFELHLRQFEITETTERCIHFAGDKRW